MQIILCEASEFKSVLRFNYLLNMTDNSIQKFTWINLSTKCWEEKNTTFFLALLFSIFTKYVNNFRWVVFIVQSIFSALFFAFIKTCIHKCNI